MRAERRPFQNLSKKFVTFGSSATRSKNLPPINMMTTFPDDDDLRSLLQDKDTVEAVDRAIEYHKRKAIEHRNRKARALLAGGGCGASKPGPQPVDPAVAAAVREAVLELLPPAGAPRERLLLLPTGASASYASASYGTSAP